VLSERLAPSIGVKIPKNVAQALTFDKDNSNTLWWDAICKDMKNERPAFEVREDGVADLPPGSKEITCHMIFDVKDGREL
jgi:hypothetical protein